MKEKIFNTPILLIIFNRPDTTSIVFEEIKKIKPQHLFIAADGPRKNKPDEFEKCVQTREIIKRVDWPCEVKTLFQEKNLGCGLGPVTAMNWFFDNIEEGIILEDDCVPDQSFFYFCQELLEYYRDNEKIMHISGNNFQNGKKRGKTSYYFSEFTHNWGWATWRRAWKFNDFYVINPDLQKHIWDKQWQLSVKKKGGLAVLPNTNLISNIGSGEGATHTTDTSEYLNIKTDDITFPLIHPQKIKKNIPADIYTYRHVFNGKIRSLFLQKILKIAPNFLTPLIKKSVNIIKIIWTYSPKNNFELIIKKIKTNDNFHNLKNISRYTKAQIKLYDKNFIIADAPSFFSMYKEIIKSEIYKFKSDSRKPLIIDCGANIGLGILYFKKRFPEAKIIAFEPDTKIFDILKYNIQSFDFSDVDLINKALWSEETKLNFFSEGADAGHIANINDNDQKNIINISTVRLKNYLNNKVDFLKLDIEGAEYEVLNDCRNLLGNVQNLFVEYHSFSDSEQKLFEILQILKEAGFRYYIHPVGALSPHPFEEIKTYLGMDLQLNIYAIRT